jgi:hypothetical protein
LRIRHPEPNGSRWATPPSLIQQWSGQSLPSRPKTAAEAETKERVAYVGCTVAEARAYMLALSRARELRSQWQHAAELLLAQADIADLSRQAELALFYDAKLDVGASYTRGNP